MMPNPIEQRVLASLAHKTIDRDAYIMLGDREDLGEALWESKVTLVDILAEIRAKELFGRDFLRRGRVFSSSLDIADVISIVTNSVTYKMKYLNADHLITFFRGFLDHDHCLSTSAAESFRALSDQGLLKIFATIRSDI